MDRREFVTAVGIGTAAGVTGCIQNVVGTRMEQAEDPWRNVETSQAGSASTVRGEAVLPQDTFATRAYQLESATELSIDFEVQSGNPVDVVTMRREEFERYTQGDNAVIQEPVSERNAASAELSGSLDPDDYVVVFDNTTWGQATPEGKETVSFSITIGGN